MLSADRFSRSIASAFEDGSRIFSSAAEKTRADASGVARAFALGCGMGPIKKSYTPSAKSVSVAW
jgi:hypothetical protein